MNGEIAHPNIHQRNYWYLLSLLLAVALVYLPFLGNPLVFDDRTFFSAGAVGYYAHAPFQFDSRWLPNASLGWTYTIFSDSNTYFFHLGNALLHAGNVILLFYLLRQLVGAVISEQENSQAIIRGAWLGALVFAIHPVAVYAVGYVIQRSILMATFFVLAMQLAYVKGLLTGHKRWLVLAVIAYFMAVFSKEHSVMMPAVLAAITVLLRARNKLDKRTLWLTGSAFVAVAVLFMLRVKGVFGVAYEFTAAMKFEQQGVIESAPMLHLLSVLTQAGLFFKYLLLWLLPNPAWMSVDMREHFIASLTSWRGWAGALGFIAYGVFAFRLLLSPRWLGLTGFALLYPWLQFWVEFSSIRVQEVFVLYRSYLWLPGMMLLFPCLLARFPGRKTVSALAVAMLLLTAFSWNRLWVFSDNYRLWNDAALLLPSEQAAGADRIFFNRGEAADLAHKWDAAVADYQRAVALSPQLAPMRYALGLAYAKSGRYREAITQFDVVISFQPDVALGYYVKGLSLIQLHERDQALVQLRKSCDLGNEKACMMAGQM